MVDRVRMGRTDHMGRTSRQSLPERPKKVPGSGFCAWRSLRTIDSASLAMANTATPISAAENAACPPRLVVVATLTNWLTASADGPWTLTSN